MTKERDFHVHCVHMRRRESRMLGCSRLVGWPCRAVSRPGIIGALDSRDNRVRTWPSSLLVKTYLPSLTPRVEATVTLLSTNRRPTRRKTSLNLRFRSTAASAHKQPIPRTRLLSSLTMPVSRRPAPPWHPSRTTLRQRHRIQVIFYRSSILLNRCFNRMRIIQAAWWPIIAIKCLAAILPMEDSVAVPHRQMRCKTRQVAAGQLAKAAAE